MSDPLAILVVCTGNICRSPLGAGFLEHHLAACGGPACAVASRGTHAVTGHPAVRESIEAAHARGIDITHHRASQFSRSDLDWADIVLVMERFHAELIEESFGRVARAKLKLFGGYAGLLDIEDPFGGDAAKFRTIAQQIWDAAQGFVRSPDLRRVPRAAPPA